MRDGPLIKYKGQNIVFREHLDEWVCDDLSMRDASLAKLKTRIDTFSRKDRKLDIRALFLHGSGWNDVPTMVEVKVGSLSEDGKTAIITYEMEKTHRSETYREKYKSKENLNSIYPLSVRDELAKYIETKREALAMTDHANTLHKAIKGYDADSIALTAKEAKAND